MLSRAPGTAQNGQLRVVIDTTLEPARQLLRVARTSNQNVVLDASGEMVVVVAVLLTLATTTKGPPEVAD